MADAAFAASVERGHLGAHGVELGRRDEVLRHQVLLALEVALRLVELDLGPAALGERLLHVGLGDKHRCARRLHVGAGLAHAVLEGLGVEPRDELALLDRRVEVGEELLDLAAHLRADLHLRDRRDGARGGDGGLQRPALQRRRAEASARVRRSPDPPRRAGGQRQQHHRDASPAERLAIDLHCPDFRQRPVRAGSRHRVFTHLYPPQRGWGSSD